MNSLLNGNDSSNNEDIKEFKYSKKIHIFILIDNSESMIMYKDLLLDSINRVLSILYNDRIAKGSADVYIMTCSNDVEILKKADR